MSEFELRLSSARAKRGDVKFGVYRGAVPIATGEYHAPSGLLAYRERAPGPSKAWVLGELRKALGFEAPKPAPVPVVAEVVRPRTERKTLPPPPPREASKK